MRILTVAIATLLTTTAAASAADYREAPFRHRGPRAAAVLDTGIRPAPPLYILEAPPRYIQDTRTGAPGRWVVRQPGLLEQLFGLPGDGYSDY